jgi:hypothetical protein
MVNNEMVRGERSGCAAVGSKFGWILSGPTKGEDMNDESLMVHLIMEGNEQLASQPPHMLKIKMATWSETLRTFWDTESIGITNHDTGNPQEYEFLREVSFDKHEGRYQVGFPWGGKSHN